MLKTIVCPECNGSGFIENENGYCEVCTRCAGIGVVKVPMTNYNVFMSMKPEEFANYIECPYMRGDPYGECKFGWHEREQTCKECIVEWLNSPAKEKYYELNEDE